MTQAIKETLKDLNRNYFDSHIDEVKWSHENNKLTIIMKTKDVMGSRERFEFSGEDGKMVYKQLMKNE
jgi:hypothetical protein